MRSVPQTKFTKPKVDTDETILEPYLSGEMNNDGYITESEQILNLNFVCKVTFVIVEQG